jgi:hypothetical protein
LLDLNNERGEGPSLLTVRSRENLHKLNGDQGMNKPLQSTRIVIAKAAESAPRLNHVLHSLDPKPRCLLWRHPGSR